ncbi:hypothetical protein BGZ68_005923 [Mortierella alpina]|nr:hypothetical protein BGZ68_005923 [Mortierella alpina]
MVKATAILLVTFALLATVQATGSNPAPTPSCKPMNPCEFDKHDYKNDNGGTSCGFTCSEGCGKSSKYHEEEFKKKIYKTCGIKGNGKGNDNDGGNDGDHGKGNDGDNGKGNDGDNGGGNDGDDGGDNGGDKNEDKDEDKDDPCLPDSAPGKSGGKGHKYKCKFANEKTRKEAEKVEYTCKCPSK